MKDSIAAAKYEKACAFLPDRLSISALNIAREKMGAVEEIRLRVGRPIHLTISGCELPLPQTRVISEDLEHVLDRVTEFSRYTAEETLRMGFATAQGGFRVGVCGTMISAGGRSEGIRDISSLSIRIPREMEDIARPLLPRLLERGRLMNTLILSPPGGGKTTLLRDLVRLVSDGSELAESMRVSLVDERGEIAAMHRGMPQLAVGSHTDVLDACPKKLAIPMLLRTMTPQVIALDEISGEADVESLCAAVNCGVVMLATAHASSACDWECRPLLKRLKSCGVFERAIVIEREKMVRSYRVEVL